MVVLTDLFHRIRNFVLRRNVERELDDELRFHVERLIEHHTRAGLSNADAERRAHVEFGGLEQIREEHRDVRGTRLLDDTARDLRYASRQIGRSPALAASVALSVGLAIGANAAIFSIVDAVLLRPLPFPDAERLVRIDGVFVRLGLRMTETGVELAYRHEAPEVGEARSFTHVGSYTAGSANVGGASPERLAVATVSPEIFLALRTTPTVGRTFTADDLTHTDRLAVISHGLWRRRFGADHEVAGRTLSINGREFAVLGVMAAGVRFPASSDVWIPAAADPQLAAQVTAPSFVARLAPGVAPHAARQELLGLLQRNPLARQDPQDASLTVTPLRDATVRDLRPVLLLVTGAALLVYLVACLNAASLLLTRVSSREREFAIRRAIGASPVRVARQTFCESLLLGALAAGVALPACWVTLQAIRRVVPMGLESALPTTLSARHLLLPIGLAVVAVSAFTVASYAAVLGERFASLRVSATTTGGRWWKTVQHALVTLQIAGGVSMLIVAAALVRTVGTLTAVDLGARNHSAVVAELTLPRASYATSNDVRRFHQAVRALLNAQPAVAAAGSTDHLPGDANQMLQSYSTALQRAGEQPGRRAVDAFRLTATPGYFEALGIDVIAGRTFTDADRQGGMQVTVVSEGVARALELRPRELLGRRIDVGVSGDDVLAEVVGVVRDVRMRGPESPAASAVYLPFAQWPINSTAFLVVQGRTSSQQLVALIRSAVAQVDGTIPLYNVRTFDDVRDEYLEARRFTMTVMLTFGIVASSLAVLGLFGVLSYVVRLRRKELVIRMALGATAQAVRREFLQGGTLRALTGLALGVGVAFASWRAAATRVPGLERLDPLDVLVVTVSMLALAVLASWLPARRAARTDPLGVLRAD